MPKHYPPEFRRDVPVTVTCRVLGFSTQGFYKWRAKPVRSRDWDDARLMMSD